MTQPTRARTVAAALAAGIALAAQPVAAAPELPARFDLGRDADGDPCFATRDWSTPGEVRLARDQPFRITCRGSTQQRGWIGRGAAATEAWSDARCGAPAPLPIPGLDAAEVRRCQDARLGREALVVRAGAWTGAGLDGVLGPLAGALRAARSGKPESAAAAVAATAPEGLAAPPAAVADTLPAATALDPATAIQLGLRYIYAGANVEASRLLNDAIAQAVTAPPLQRAELRLNAGLADSNIGEFGAADAHFADAERLLAATPAPDLAQQAATYRALHLANQSRWEEVLRTLDSVGENVFPLADPATLAAVNQVPAAAFRTGIDAQRINGLILDVQRKALRSTAELQLKRLDASEKTLAEAVAAERQITEALSPTEGAPRAIGWLRARLERQQGRVHAAGGRIDAALASFECAIADMQGVALRNPAGCLFRDEATLGGALAGPVIAETQLERSALLERKSGVGRAEKLASYRAAVDTLAASSGAAAATSPLLGRYLDLLTAGASTSEQEEYFRTLQTVREPGIAREYATLQAIVSGGRAGSLVRDREELERTRTRLRYEIARLPEGAPELASKMASRDRAEQELDKVKAELRANGGFAAVDDEPVTLATLAAALRPGETYLRLVTIGPRVYATAVSAEGTTTWTVKTPAAEVARAVEAVLTSSRSYAAPGGRRLPAFDVDGAHKLFVTLAGPVAAKLASARSIVVDASTVLGSLPAAVLVTAPAVVARSASADYSTVPFLARRTDLATALSPQAFMRVRTGLAPSAVRRALIGFGDNELAPPAATPALAETVVPLGAACQLRYADWARQFNSNRPIPADEIRAGAAALGVPDAPVVTGAAFSDAALLRDSARGELAQYQVLHFATHGIPATVRDGCDTPVPPSLITSIEPPAAVAEAGAPPPSDGLLSYVDVARLKLDANLVVLSACETAAGVDTVGGRLGGQERSSATLDGLVRSFIVAQARAVIATYWRVPAQQGTQALIAAFYRNGRDRGMGAALRAAQAEVAANPRTSHPYYWAAFFLVGDGAKTMLSPSAVALR